jgi:hypothetical protein
MTLLRPHRRQCGYLLEIPILLVLTALGVAFLLPQMSPVGRKILLGIAVLPVVFCLFYMIVTPGWQPNSGGRLKPPWRLLGFLLLAAGIVVGVVKIIIS